VVVILKLPSALRPVVKDPSKFRVFLAVMLCVVLVQLVLSRYILEGRMEMGATIAALLELLLVGIGLFLENVIWPLQDWRHGRRG
jgi:hypothetical protein